MTETVTERLEGVGIGLRSAHYREMLARQPDLPWLEILTDNYLGEGGQPLSFLRQFAAHYPLSFHCVGMSLGSAEAPDREYFRRLKRRVDEFRPVHVSDHLCWSSFHGRHSHDLLPMPYTATNARFFASKIQWAQDCLGRRILIENVSSYLTYAESSMEEWEFMIDIVRMADCDLLCDVNNIHVSAVNHGFDPLTYLQALPAGRVREIHLAGYEDQGTHLLDSHSRPVSEEVWALYRSALQRFGPVPTLIEWDNDLPALDDLLAEADKARQLLRGIHAAA